MYDSVLNIQRGDDAELLRSAVLKLAAPLSTAARLPVPVSPKHPELPRLLGGLEILLYDGLTAPRVDLWPYVTQHFADPTVGDDVGAGVEAGVLQEQAGVLRQVAAAAPPSPPAHWHSRVWLLLSLRSGTLLPALHPLLLAPAQYYDSDAFLAARSGQEFLRAALQALTPLQLELGPSDLRLFPKLPKRPPRAVKPSPATPSPPATLDAACVPEEVHRRHARAVCRVTEVVCITAHPSLRIEAMEPLPSSQPKPERGHCSRAVQVCLPPPAPVAPEVPEFAVPLADLDDTALSTSSSDHQFDILIQGMNSVLESHDEDQEADADAIRLLQAFQTAAVALQALGRRPATPLPVLAARHAPTLPAVWPLLDVAASPPPPPNWPTARRTLLQDMQASLSSLDTAPAEPLGVSRVTQWLRGQQWCREEAGALALLRYLEAEEELQLLEPPDGEPRVILTAPPPPSPRQSKKSASSWLEDIIFDHNGEQLEGPMRGRLEGEPDFADLYCVLRGFHLSCWKGEDLFRKNCEEDDILDLRGAFISIIGDFIFGIQGPQLPVRWELLVEEADHRAQWVARLRGAAGRAVLRVPELQAWLPVKGWTDWSPTEPFKATDQLVLDSGYEWVGDWAVEVGDGGGDREGWQYAVAFGFAWHPLAGAADCVRQRTWLRIARRK